MEKRMEQIDEVELRKAIEQLHPDNSLFEIRVLEKKKTLSGYFHDADTLLEAFKTIDLRGRNIYITLNQLDKSLFSREQSERFVLGANSTSDNDVEVYKWLFIDLDPVRAAGVSSTDDELMQAVELGKKIHKYLQDRGFEEPVKAISGNGAHLLYRIQLTNDKDDENKKLIEKCLKVLSMFFDNEHVTVDTANFNPSRICKLYGTLAQKGRSTKERPHRMSYLSEDVKPVQKTARDKLVALANELPEEKAPVPNNQYNSYGTKPFDIEEWMSRYGIRYKAKEPFHGGTKYILEECPFNSSHKAKDSMITISNSGAVGFKCLHNSCSDKHWQDLRLLYEPNAYEFNDVDRRIEEGWAKHNRERKEQLTEEALDDLPVFQTARMIIDRSDSDPEYVRTGIKVLDKQLNGLEKGKLSVISGLRGAAKSTVLSEIMLNVLDDGHAVVAYSGELSDKSFMNWMMFQAAGAGYIEQSARFENSFYVKDDIKRQIADWMGDRFQLYNNKKKLNLEKLTEAIEQEALNIQADLIIVDNLMALDVGEKNRRNEYEAQTLFMWDLKHMAEVTNAHVILVAHPRKAMGFLRLEDISGTGNIGNVADNVFIVHRVNADFERLSKDILKATGYDYLLKAPEPLRCTNVIEIAKDRERGTCDVFVPLYYEAKSKRLLNYKQEIKIYGWNKEDEV